MDSLVLSIEQAQTRTRLQGMWNRANRFLTRKRKRSAAPFSLEGMSLPQIQLKYGASKVEQFASVQPMPDGTQEALGLVNLTHFVPKRRIGRVFSKE